MRESFRNATASRLDFGADVSQLLAANRQAHRVLARYGLGTHNLLILDAIAERLHTCNVQPNAFMYPGNTLLMTRLLLHIGAAHDNTFYHAVVEALSNEVQLCTQFMSSINGIVGAADDADATNSLSAVFGRGPADRHHQRPSPGGPSSKRPDRTGYTTGSCIWCGFLLGGG